MDKARFLEISSKVVRFYLNIDDISMRKAFRMSIAENFIELGKKIDDEEFLCEESTALVIVHKITRLPLPQDLDKKKEFVYKMYNFVGFEEGEFSRWFKIINRNNLTKKKFYIKKDSNSEGKYN